jgi:elongation factor P--beta-lysine ligase
MSLLENVQLVVITILINNMWTEETDTHTQRDRERQRQRQRDRQRQEARDIDRQRAGGKEKAFTL